jgi:hypothetical protein
VFTFVINFNLSLLRKCGQASWTADTEGFRSCLNQDTLSVTVNRLTAPCKSVPSFNLTNLLKDTPELDKVAAKVEMLCSCAKNMPLSTLKDSDPESIFAHSRYSSLHNVALDNELEKEHETRLQNLLIELSLKAESISKDGNCLFKYAELN